MISSNPDDTLIEIVVKAPRIEDEEIFIHYLNKIMQNEYLKRIEALKTVNDPELRKLRDRCLAILSEELRK